MPNSSPINTIQIMGKSGGAVDNGAIGLSGVNSIENNTGQNGADGSYSWLGGCTAAQNGTAGAPGVSGGGPGLVGQNGTSAPDFTLRVDTFVFPNGGNMYILSQGGDGGQGGNGGQGGAGAPGGNAGNTDGTHDKYDEKCLQTGKCPPALGGQGGNGMPGGKGGRGGNGGNGGNIQVFYKNGNNLNQVVISAPPGTFGNPGTPGAGGIGGKGGMNEIWPSGSAQTYATDGLTGVVTGDNGAGTTGQRGSIKLTPITENQ